MNDVTAAGIYGTDYPDTPEWQLDPNGVDPDLADLRTGTWLDQQTFPELTWAIPGIIPEGMSLLVGPPKVGKSWLILAAALASAYGGYVLGKIRVPYRPVLYLALEDGDRRLQKRCRTILNDHPIPEHFTYSTKLAPGKLIATITAWIRQYGDQSLIILDTLGKVMPPSYPGESAYQRDYRVGSTLKNITDESPGLALTVIHHDRKASSEDFVDAVSGTHGLAGSADTTVVLSRKRTEAEGLLKVTGRDVDEQEYAVSFRDASWYLDGDDLTEAAERAAARRTTENVGDEMSRIIQYVSVEAGGARAKDIAAALQMPENKVRMYLSRAVDAHRLDKADRGLYVGVASVASVAL